MSPYIPKKKKKKKKKSHPKKKKKKIKKKKEIEQNLSLYIYTIFGNTFQ